MFYPFSDTSGIELKAYASAKPFGGRIGPRIFDIKSRSNGPAIKPASPIIIELTN